jgi:nucleotide-binding universal stress UspA family protein
MHVSAKAPTVISIASAGTRCCRCSRAGQWCGAAPYRGRRADPQLRLCQRLIKNWTPHGDEEARLAAEGYLQRLAGRLQHTGVRAEGHAILAPDVAQELSAEADRTNADLVIMSTHAHRGLARALLGTGAEAVVRAGNRPVLLIHQHARSRLRMEPSDGIMPRLESRSV